MQIDRRKLDIAMARKSISMPELMDVTGLRRETITCYKPRKRGTRPETVGLIAKALGVDVTEILKDEE